MGSNYFTVNVVFHYVLVNGGSLVSVFLMRISQIDTMVADGQHLDLELALKIAHGT